jgi:hypothetical protein
MRRRAPPQFRDRAVSLQQTPALHHSLLFLAMMVQIGALPEGLIKIWEPFSILMETQVLGGCLILDDQLWSLNSLCITVRIAAGIG